MSPFYYARVMEVIKKYQTIARNYQSIWKQLDDRIDPLYKENAKLREEVRHYRDAMDAAQQRAEVAEQRLADIRAVVSEEDI